MAEIDSLEIKIQSAASKVNESLDVLVRKLGLVAEGINAISNNKGLEEFAKKAESVAKDMEVLQGKMKEAAKSIEPQMQKAAKSLEQITEQYKDLGKGFEFKGSASAIQKQIEKYSNALEAAKLKKQELEMAGKTEGQMYEYAVRDVLKYSNVIESLKNQLNGLGNESKNYEINIDFGKTEKRLQDFVDRLSRFDSIIEAGGQETESGIVFPVRGLEISLEQLKEKFPEAKELISAYEAEIERARELSSNVPFQSYGTVDLTQFEQIGKKTREASERLKDFGAKLSQLEVPEIQENNLDKLRSSLEKTEAKLDELRTKLVNGITMGRITESVDDAGYRNLQEQIALTEKQAEALRTKIQEVGNSAGNVSGFDRLSKAASSLASASKKVQNALSSTLSVMKKIDSGIKGVFSKFSKLAKSMTETSKSSKKMDLSFSNGIKTILKYGLGIRSAYALIGRLRKGIVAGYTNLAQYSDEVNKSISMLMNSLNQAKNAFAAATSPIFNAFAPALNYVIQLCIKASNYINQLFSALSGSSTWIRAKELTDDYAASLDKTTKSAQKALQPFDELNNISTQSGSDSSTGTSAKDMFETLPVETKFKELAEKIKSIMSQVFAPLKAAWDSQGQYVMESWKTALNKVWTLVKDIGKDFLTVWNQPATITMLKNILSIFGNIGVAVGNIASGLDKAWKKNETGKKILENIRDIFAAVVKHVKTMSEYTIDWSADLDFSPLLESFEGLTASLVPVVDSISGVLSDFYTQVLLPLGKWTIEKGLPDLLDVFTKFNEKVDWESLRSNLSEFWEHLEPFAETVGEGLIIFISRVSELVANFLNSETFVNFLHDLEDWMDKVTPEDVADGIEKLAKAFVAFEIAMAAFKVGGTVAKSLTFLLENLTALKALGTIALVITVAVEGFELGKEIGKILFPDDAEYYDDFSWKEFFGTFTDGSWLGAIEESVNEALPVLGMPFSVILAKGTEVKDKIKEKFTELTPILAAPFTTGISKATELKTSISDKWKNIRTNTETSWNNVREKVNIAITKAKTTVDTKAEGIKSTISTKWGNVKTETSTAWENVKTNVTTAIDKAKTTVDTKAEGIKSTISTKWGNVKTETSTAWENVKTNVTTAIDKAKTTVDTKAEGIRSTIETKFESARENVETVTGKMTEYLGNVWSGIESGLSTAWSNGIEAVKKLWNSFAKWINEKLTIKFDTSTVIGKGISEILGRSTISLGALPTFATGGFPEDGLFMANHGELVGKFANGKTAVANNKQITDGIAIAVQNANSEQNQLLRQQNELLLQILQKETGISGSAIFDSVRKSAKEYSNRTGRPAFDY